MAAGGVGRLPERWMAALVLTIATLIAALGARPYAGGWNGGSSSQRAWGGGSSPREIAL